MFVCNAFILKTLKLKNLVSFSSFFVFFLPQGLTDDLFRFWVCYIKDKLAKPVVCIKACVSVVQ